MSDLIERLRSVALHGNVLATEAADEIERLNGVVSDYWDDKIKSMDRIKALEDVLDAARKYYEGSGMPTPKQLEHRHDLAQAIAAADTAEEGQ